MSRVYVNVHLSGTIAIADLPKLTALITPEENPQPSLGNTASAQIHHPDAPLPEAVPAKVAEAPAAGAPTGETDAAGTVFDPTRHTGTKVKSGLWRMKTGLSRPESEGENSPNYVNPNASPADAKASTGDAANGSAAGAAAGSTAAVDEDDEFAAFSAAAAEPAVTAKARTWSDADLSKLTNQAAQKLGSPDKVRETIAKHVPADQTPHSRNIPADKREAFAVELEGIAGIEYAG